MPDTPAVSPGGRVRPVVVVTRPLAQALPLQQKILAIGRRAVVFPLLGIEPLTDTAALDAALARLTQFALVAFVSPNAIDAAFARRPAWPADLPLAIMGEGSLQALAAHGVTDATHRIHRPLDRERTDSQTLLAALDLPALAGQSVLILRGESGRELLADSLRAAGARVEQVAAYRRTVPQPDAAARAQLLRWLDEGSEWVITSSEALENLVRMVAGLPGIALPRLQQQLLIVPHARIAETAGTLGFCNVLLTASGDERILAALQFRNE